MEENCHVPDFLRTEWKEQGRIEVEFLNVNDAIPDKISSGEIKLQCNEPIYYENNDVYQKDKFENENYKTDTDIATETFSVSCSFSTFSIWEYKTNDKLCLTSEAKWRENSEENAVESLEEPILEMEPNCVTPSIDTNNLNKSTSVEEMENISMDKLPSEVTSESSLTDQNTEFQSSPVSTSEIEDESKAIEPVILPNSQICKTNVTKGNDTLKNSGGVAWALQYCREQAKAHDDNRCIEESANDLCHKKLVTNIGEMNSSYDIGLNDIGEVNAVNEIRLNDIGEMSASNEISDISLIETTLITKCYNFIKDSVFDFLGFFSSTASLTKLFLLSTVKGYLSLNVSHIPTDPFYSEEGIMRCQLNRMESKALNCLKRNFGRLVKILPRVPLLNKTYGIAVKKVLYLKYSHNDRGRIDELISISKSVPAFNDTTNQNLAAINNDDGHLEKSSNKYHGLIVTYLTEEEVNYILNKQLMHRSASKDNILHSVPLEDEILEYDTSQKNCEASGNNSETIMPSSKYDDMPVNAYVIFDEAGNPVEIFDDAGNPVVETFDGAGNPVETFDDSVNLLSFKQKVKKVVRSFKLMRLFNNKNIDIPQDIPKSASNYWVQRYRLFLRYDDGVHLDEESWYSVTPEMIAAHQALRCACDTVIDAFCGAGGNAIQLAAFCNKVIAIDIDPKKIELARNNARVYGVQDRIEFIVGDFFELAPELEADVVFLSPPWGGISYAKKGSYDVFKLDGKIDCKKLIETAASISHDFALYLPKSSNVFQVIELAGPDGRVDIEYAHISNKRKGLTAYYGNLVDYNYEDNDY